MLQRERQAGQGKDERQTHKTAAAPYLWLRRKVSFHMSICSTLAKFCAKNWSRTALPSPFHVSASMPLMTKERRKESMGYPSSSFSNRTLAHVGESEGFGEGPLVGWRDGRSVGDSEGAGEGDLVGLRARGEEQGAGGQMELQGGRGE